MKFLYNYRLFIIFSINIFFSFSLKYPHIIYLSNGYIFTIHETGIAIYDHLFINKIKEVFTFSEKIKLNDISKITITTEDEYIFCIIQDEIYIANDNGDILFHNETSFLKKDIFPKYYSLVVIKDEDNNAYKYIISYLYNKYLYHNYFQFNTNSNNNTFIQATEGDSYNRNLAYLFVDNDALTCQYMINKDNVEVIVCFLLATSVLGYSEIRLDGYFDIIKDNLYHNTHLFLLEMIKLMISNVLNLLQILLVTRL